MKKFTLLISCIDRPGIVATVSSFLYETGLNILESNQFGDLKTGRFFMRVAFTTADPADDVKKKELQDKFKDISEKFEMDWQLFDMNLNTPAIIMVSKFDHCLVDLLYRCRIGTLNMDIAAVISNHDTARELVDREGIPFHHIPVTADTKQDAETQIRKIISETSAELVILARYMQILSSDMTNSYPGKIINIHHSFLPSFKGAEPYSQAYHRGVKMIGATAHYVTPNLDEGPIIAQQVVPVRHDMSVEDMIGAGQEIEQSVMAKAIRAHTEHRILLNEGKTVVFD
ncbi:MAG: formyltetrahydrofolate deformylase [Candidatus Micropelagos sp.]|uniref:Formyltetrahydrofolate deformylase n=1 Tax=PS1 clade bacterium TaxID=2175152 RepID=A0A368ELI4_9PROT|nr:formyltetrahydrofolate deformylase [Hyphomicrobiales bacterium]OUV51799.1 MAG: formyltetrahydrofolate deformylase [Alphaproteobacteria bacterium TMED110]RCL85710.1 MAG: formyltetrahydrofolate deformylase [PS1 clade bacterium]